MYIFITLLVKVGEMIRDVLFPRRHVWNLWRLSSVVFSLLRLTTFWVLQWFFSFNSLTLCRWRMFHFEPACCQIARHHRWWVTAQPTSSGNPAITNLSHCPYFCDVQNTQTLGVIKGLKMRDTKKGIWKSERPETILAAEEFKANPSECTMNKLTGYDFYFHVTSTCVIGVASAWIKYE